MCPGVTLGVVVQLGVQWDVPRCEIGSGGDIWWIMGGAQV